MVVKAKPAENPVRYYMLIIERDGLKCDSTDEAVSPIRDLTQKSIRVIKQELSVVGNYAAII